jgi:hypothetical protein
MATYDPWFDTDALNDWMALPQATRPTLEEFKAQRRRRRAQGLTLPLSGTASTQQIQWARKTRPVRKATTSSGSSRASATKKVAARAPRPPLAVRQPDFLSTLDRERVRRELQLANAQKREQATKTESGFRRWLTTVLGNTAGTVISTLAVGTLRLTWIAILGVHPPF